MSAADMWTAFRELCCHLPGLDVTVDVSRVTMEDGYLDAMEGAVEEAMEEMAALEGGAIANEDEGRQVGHYWLRAPELAPSASVTEAIREATEQVRAFAEGVHTGAIRPPTEDRFTDLLLIGVGGSALGPELVADALSSPDDRLRPHFFDNTDPDGMDRVLASLGDRLASTLLVVVSKSGGTTETRNGMLEAEAALRRAGLTPGPQAVAVTSGGSKLDAHAKEAGYLATFPMWDFVGGRTSVTSAVGLLPAALQGIDIDALLDGARRMDQATRNPVQRDNPAVLLALAWYAEGEGRGSKNMVVLPYKDRLLLMSRYLQQLVMESIGKELNREGVRVEQGLSVYGNKGSTDQHAFVQQLRDGAHDFFVTFIDVLQDRGSDSLEVEPDLTAGDYLTGFLLGTRDALFDKARGSITVTLPDVSARSLGALIALYERAVGIYATLIDVNAYHQPGVEAGKKAAAGVVALQRAVLNTLRDLRGEALDVVEIAGRCGEEERVDVIFTLLRHLVASGHHAVEQVGDDPFDAKWRVTDR